ncbi:MAG: B12-binding domain-containing protein [Acidimicrobiales bacterium]|jgi:excisionase family DNA binding protein
MAKRQLSLPQVAEKLGVHYMTAYRYVRTGRLPAKRVAGTWQVELADLENMRKDGRASRQHRPTGTIPARAHLEARMIASDEPGAWEVLEAALGSGMEPEDVLLEIVVPTMRSIGALWERGELTVADEHRASSVATRLISRLGARFGRRGHKRGTVILAAPPGELHAGPVAIAANLLRWRGFAAVELGANTPVDALAEAAAGESDLIAVGIACTTRSSAQSARKAISALRASVPKVPILLGGAAITNEAHAHRLGADVFTGSDGDELVRALEKIADERR